MGNERGRDSESKRRETTRQDSDKRREDAPGSIRRGTSTGNEKHVRKREEDRKKANREKNREQRRGKKEGAGNGVPPSGGRELEPGAPGDMDSGDKLGKPGTDASETAERHGLRGNKKGKGKLPSEGKKGFNPLSYKSVKENVVERGIDRGTKEVLNKYGFGLGTLLEKVNKVATGETKINYSKKVPKQGKILIAVATLSIVLVVWLFLFLAFLLILFGAAGLLMSDGDGGGGGSGGGGTVAPDSGYTGGKGKPMPPELVGKFLMPNTEKATSMVGQRSNPTDPGSVPRMHKGTDFTHAIKGKTDVKLYPVAPGKVYYVTDGRSNGSGTGWGNYVRIDHGGYTSLYGHLSPGITVKVGDEVGMDSLIGIMGHTGNSTGYHLHLEMYTGGQADHAKDANWRDPLKLLSCTESKAVPYGSGMKTECHNYQKKIRGIE